MKFTYSPKVFMIAKTETVDYALKEWLEHLGVGDWKTDVHGAQQLIELAGRRCYRAFQSETVAVGERRTFRL